MFLLLIIIVTCIVVVIVIIIIIIAELICRVGMSVPLKPILAEQGERGGMSRRNHIYIFLAVQNSSIGDLVTD